MTPSQLLDLARDAGGVLLLVAGPVLAIALGVGILTSIVQAATQLSDSTLSFVPKLAALVVVLGLGGSWLLGHLEDHMSRSFTRIVDIGKGNTP